jgi:hypothetical protein
MPHLRVTLHSLGDLEFPVQTDDLAARYEPTEATIRQIGVMTARPGQIGTPHVSGYAGGSHFARPSAQRRHLPSARRCRKFGPQPVAIGDVLQQQVFKTR